MTCSLFLHHFHEDAAALLVSEFARVAARAVVVNDLARGFVPWIAIRALSILFAESPMFKNDAPLSVLKSWTAAELLDVAERAGLKSRAEISRRVPYRLVMIIDRGGGA